MKHDPKTPFDIGGLDRTNLLLEIAGQMIIGVGIAAVAILVPALLIFGIYILGTFLPPESKEADDPLPDSFSFFLEEEPDTILRLGLIDRRL